MSSTREPSTPFAAKAPSSVGAADQARDDDSEYEEVDDLIYERTGTLCFPYPARLVENAARATEAAKAPREARAPRDPSEPRAAAASRALGAARSVPEPLARIPQVRLSTQPRLRARLPARRAYPSFGQRLLAEVRRIPLAKRRAALAVVAAIAIGVCLASSWRWLRRIAREREAARSSAAAVIDGRARAPEPSNDPPRLDAVAEEHDAAPLDRPDVGAPLGGPRAKGAKPTSRPKPRAPTPPQHEPCVCLPGDPLCGCLD